MESLNLDTLEYTIEVWDINDVFVMDITKFVKTSLRISIPLNDVEDVGFTIDLVQFEKACAEINANPRSILEPYRTDIKIRRNGQYICGAQVVQLTIRYNSQEPNSVEVKCTGFLNYFKDRYLSKVYSNMTYAQIARQLITNTEGLPNLISNYNFLKDISGWSATDTTYIYWDSGVGVQTKGSLFAGLSGGSSDWGGAQVKADLKAGVTYSLSYWMKTTTSDGTTYASPAPGVQEGVTSVPDTNWNQYSVTWTQSIDYEYLQIKTTNGKKDFYLDDVVLTSNEYDPRVYDFGVTLGPDYASPNQDSTRYREYDLQIVKDGILNLTSLENDNFDFEFTANKEFITYSRIGSDKPEIELVYPQNIQSMVLLRDAGTLANRIIGIGSGIGSERIESIVVDETSALTYRTRERAETFNDIKEEDILEENTKGLLAGYKDVYEIPSITVELNKVDVSSLKIGDAITVRIDNSPFADNIDGVYRIIKIDIDVDTEFGESVSLDLIKWGGRND